MRNSWAILGSALGRLGFMIVVTLLTATLGAAWSDFALNSTEIGCVIPSPIDTFVDRSALESTDPPWLPLMSCALWYVAFAVDGAISLRSAERASRQILFAACFLGTTLFWLAGFNRLGGHFVAGSNEAGYPRESIVSLMVISTYFGCEIWSFVRNKVLKGPRQSQSVGDETK
jgi:hypothetical protein